MESFLFLGMGVRIVGIVGHTWHDAVACLLRMVEQRRFIRVFRITTPAV